MAASVFELFPAEGPCPQPGRPEAGKGSQLPPSYIVVWGDLVVTLPGPRGPVLNGLHDRIPATLAPRAGGR